jgi:hypothetical protein
MPRVLQLEPYGDQRRRWPAAGKPVLAHHDEELLVVYQAYNPAIASWVVANGKLGGPGYGFHRASWVKPSFLWMMYRCGWCTKPNQERVLALWIERARFESLLAASELSHYVAGHHESEAAWKAGIARTDVRVQWDPDRQPGGSELGRRAIQVGLMGEALRAFATEAIVEVQDITPLVVEQRARLATPDEVLVPVQRVMALRDERARRGVGAD